MKINFVLFITILLRCPWVELRPNPYKLVKVVRPKNTFILRQVAKIVHNDSDEEIQHLK